MIPQIELKLNLRNLRNKSNIMILECWMLIGVDCEVRWGEWLGLGLGDNVVDNSVGWWLMLVVVNNQVPLDIFWGQNTIYVSAAGGDLCLSSHSHWSGGLTPSFCWPTQAGAAAWSSLQLAPLGWKYGNVGININNSDHRYHRRGEEVYSGHECLTLHHNIQTAVLIHTRTSGYLHNTIEI